MTGRAIPTVVLDRLLGHRVYPDRQHVVKLNPKSPPEVGEAVLVEGTRCIVTRVRVSWEGPTWTLKSLRVRIAR